MYLLYAALNQFVNRTKIKTQVPFIIENPDDVKPYNYNLPVCYAFISYTLTNND